MDGGQRKRVKQVFHEALDRSGTERDAFVVAACAGEPDLLARVQALLAAHDEAGEFLALPNVAEATLTASSPGERPGTRIGPYKLLQVIGEGGFGVVFMAEQEEPVSRRVALKVIKLGMDTRQVIARFEAERQALALMEHPNIARVFDAGATATGRPYFAMELVKGVPITEYCDKNSLTTRKRLELFEDVCHAVQHAHQKGIIHRDIKPSNVLVTLHDGAPVPKVIDFGIAKATHQRLTEKTLFTEYGQFIGTPAYMSPEQAEMSGLDVDTRSDIYSLGVLLYELLTGTTPFDVKTLREAGYAEIQRVIREDEPPKPSLRLSTLDGALDEIALHRSTDAAALARRIRGDLDWIVMRTLEKDRTRRYGAPSELAADIRRHLAHEPVTAGPPGLAYRSRKFLRRHRLGVSVAGIVVLALVAGLAAATWGLIEARRANVRAQREATTAERVSEFLVGLFELSDPDEARGNAITVREVLDTGVEKIEDELAGEPRIRARMLGTMGRVYSNLGLLDAAEPLLEEASDLETELSFDADSDTPVKLAWLYLKLGRYDEAERLYRATLQRRERELGEEHSQTAMAMQGLGNLYRILDRTDEAEPLLDRALEIQERALGRSHRDTLQIMGNLSVVYSTQGRHEKAIPLTRECLRGFLEDLGADHPTTLAVQRILAWQLGELGRADEAERVLLDSIATQRRVLGEDHPQLLAGLRLLGELYATAGRHAEAVPPYLEMIEGSRRVRGEEHMYTLAAQEELADIYKALGRFEDAEDLLLESLEIRRRSAGCDDPKTLRSMGYLVDLYEEMGQPEKARQVARELLTLRKDAEGPSG